MAADVTVDRKITLVLSGDLAGTQEYEAATNVDAAAVVYSYTIPAGNTVQFNVPGPLVTGKTTKSLTIVKPSDYAGTLLLKGQNATPDADAIALHPTDPDSISIASTVAAVYIKASAICSLILIWG